MRTITLLIPFKPLLLLSAALLTAQAGFGYDQVTAGAYSGSTVEKSATATPNDLAGFTAAVTAAYATNAGGVFNLPTSVPNNTTLFRGTYGASQAKRLECTPSRSMQNVTSSGSFIPVSSPNGTTTTTDVSGYNLAIGPVTEAVTGMVLPEAVVRVGFTILSRTGGSYPLDVTATVSFSDGSTQALTAGIGGTKGTDDTFYGFTAPSGLFITNIALASFATGTSTPVNTRIGFDDFGFMTGPTVPPPQVLNVTPFNYAMARVADGVQFQVFSYEPIAPAGIALVLNATDVSSQLVVTGTATNRQVTFSGLLPNRTYDMQITVSNLAGVTSSSSRFYTAESPFTLFDSSGFADSSLYPLGPLMALTNAGCIWTPPADAATIVDSGDPQYGPALQQMQMGIDESTYLEFPYVASGVLRVAFDARVSNPYARTIDLSLMTAAGGQQTSFLGWGVVTNQFGTNSGQVAYYDGSAWAGLFELDSGWHHYELTNYLSGPCSNSFDLAVDGKVLGLKLPMRTFLPPQTPIGRLRLATMRGAILEYGQVDNLLLQATPEDPSVAPRPQLLNLTPANYAVVWPTDGIQFQALSYLPIDPAGISLVLNSNDVSSQLVFTGNATNRQASLSGLVPNQIYDLQITISNAAGISTGASRFYTASAEAPFLLFDAGGFADAGLYPPGLLQAITNGRAYWIPPVDAATLIDSGTAQFGPVLQQMQMGMDETTYLQFPPVASGVLRIAFDARVSNPLVRTIDLSLNTATGNQQASFIGWGTATNEFGTNLNQLAYYTGTNWVGVAGLDTAWHHYELTNYLSGPNAATFDLSVDGTLCGRALPWRGVAAQTPMGRLRLAAIRGGVLEYGQIDNLLLTVVPAAGVPLPVTLLHPSGAGGGLRFSFQSQAGLTYQVQYTSALGSGSWTDLVTIPGDGSVKTVSDSNAATARYYRVRTQ